MKIPEKTEITSGLEELFLQASGENEKQFLSALIPVDTSLGKGVEGITNACDFELQEICEFCNQINGYLDTAKNQRERMRLNLAVYCKIIEADHPFVVIWNLLRTISNQPVSWSFYTLNKKGQKEVCQFPNQKFQEIQKFSDKQKIGKIISNLWHPEIRNAFSHSSYFLSNANLIISRDLSPVSRKGHAECSFPHSAIESLSSATKFFFHSYLNIYKTWSSKFKTGEIYEIMSGKIIWDLSLCRWVALGKNITSGK